MSYFQMIRDLLDKQPTPKPYPWTLPVTRAEDEQNQLLTAGGYPVQPPQTPRPLIYNTQDPEYYPTYEDTKEEPTEVLFELDGWRIEHYENSNESECDWISHYCPVYGWVYCIDKWNLIADGLCPSCCMEVPDSVMGVWKLNNFDILPDREAAIFTNAIHVFPNSSEPAEPWWM